MLAAATGSGSVDEVRTVFHGGPVIRAAGHKGHLESSPADYWACLRARLGATRGGSSGCFG